MAIRSVFQRSGLNLDRFAKMAKKISPLKFDLAFFEEVPKAEIQFF